MDPSSQKELFLVSIAVAVAVSMYVCKKVYWWYPPHQHSWFTNLAGVEIRAPAEPNGPELLSLVSRDELLDWYNGGALDIQRYEHNHIAKSFDDVLGPLY